MSSNEGRSVADGLAVLRRRWSLVLLFTVLAVGVGLAVSLSSAKQYDATAKLLLVENGSTSPVLNSANVAQTPEDPQRDVNNAINTIRLVSIADSVRNALSLRVSDQTLLNEISTSADPTNSDVVTITARDHSPVRAAAIANQFAQQYIAFRLALARGNFDHAANLALAQLHSLPPGQVDSSAGQELVARARELQIDAALQTGGVELVSGARVPIHPSRPRPVLTGAIALVVGLLLGIAAAFGLELIDRRFRTEEELERGYGLPVLATIPRLPRRETAQRDGHQQEAYGMLAAVLKDVGLREAGNVLLVTSAMSGEGKTSVTLGLARALARLGVLSIAVEADLRRPSFRTELRLPQTAGLSDVLKGTARLSQELRWLEADGLGSLPAQSVRSRVGFGVVPAGIPPANPQLMLSRPTMRAVIRALRRAADVVLIDAPPIGAVSDAAALSPLVDRTIIIGRLDLSTRDGARRLRRVLDNSSADPIGLVIVGAEPASDRYGYYAYPTEDSTDLLLSSREAGPGVNGRSGLGADAGAERELQGSPDASE